MKNRRIGKIISLLLTSVLLLSSCETTGDNNSTKGEGLVLSEIMAKNNGVLADDTGEYSDWIELYNSSDKDINLSGYSITNDIKKPGKFIFPDFIIKAGEYFVLYASGKDMVDADKRIIHLSFKVNATSDNIYLLNGVKSEIGHIEIDNLPENMSCGPNKDGKVVIFEKPTPGAENDPNEYTRPAINSIPLSDAKVWINEYTTNNSVTLADEDSEFVSWVELYNYGEKEISLGGFMLSDDAAEKNKWIFPDVELPSGGYQVVLLSGKSKVYEQGKELHASFVLSGKESKLSLYTGKGELIDECQVYDLTSNLSYGRTAENPDKWQFFARATPGEKNTVPGFDSIESALYPKNKPVVFSEAAAVNITGVKASDGKYYDYIEIYNPSGQTVNLKEYKIAKSADTLKWHKLPDVNIENNEYALIYCGDADSYNKKTGEIFVKMGINRYGDDLYLINEKNIVVDSITTGRLDDKYSCGRVSMEDPAVYFFDKITPLMSNPESGLKGPAPSPIFSSKGGYAESGEKVQISSPGSVIRYTTDGSIPTDKSQEYKGELIISETVTIRARAFKDGYLPSDDISASYIVGRKHTLPVIFLSTNSENLFDHNTGIFADGPNKSSTFPYKGANYWQDWEKPIHFEYMDENGNMQLQFNAGIKVFGQYSRALDQKSISINLRDKYGPKEICYPFFRDGKVNVFSSFVLRNSGQDNEMAHIRDAFCAMVVKGQMDLDIMDYRPVVVYLNGEYYGFYDLRDRINEDYVANRTGADPENVDLIKGNSRVLSGSITDYNELLEYVDKHDLSNNEYYKYVSSIIDIDELINFWISESFFNNTDTGNIKFYNSGEEGAKWRWIMYDMDWALFPSTYEWNMIEEVFNPKGHGVGKMFSTKLMCSLIKNKEFKEKFISTYANYLNTVFDTDRMLKIYDELVAEIDNEMKYHIEKWKTHKSYDTWKSYCSTLRRIISEKNNLTRRDLINTFKLSEEQITKYSLTKKND